VRVRAGEPMAAKPAATPPATTATVAIVIAR
jgi:hypothetical protein